MSVQNDFLTEEEVRTSEFRCRVQNMVARIKAGEETAHEELIKLVESAGSIESAIEEVVGDLLNEAAEAYECLQQAKAQLERQEAAQQSEDFRRGREWAAKIFRSKGFEKAAQLVEMELSEEMTGRELADVSRVLCEDIKAAGLYGPPKYWAYVQANQAREMAQKKANEKVVEVFSRFLKELEKVRFLVEEEIPFSPKRDHDRLCRWAEAALVRAQSNKPYGWALGAIERLILAQDSNEVNSLLRKDPELAGTVSAAIEGSRATTLVETLYNRAEQMVNDLRKKIEDRREKAREKSVGRRERQLMRSAECLARKGHNPTPSRGRGKLGKRAVNDPHYRGPKNWH